MYELSEMFGHRGGSDAFGRRAVKNIGIRMLKLVPLNGTPSSVGSLVSKQAAAGTG